MASLSSTFPVSGWPSVRVREPSASGHAFHSRVAVRASSVSDWKEVIDKKSGQPYYWNIKTNETAWTIPHTESEPGPTDEKLPLDELTRILLSAVALDSSRFGDVANHYRPQCFEDELFEHLTNTINSTNDKDEKEAYERLRARLSNPLLRNPPPY